MIELGYNITVISSDNKIIRGFEKVKFIHNSYTSVSGNSLKRCKQIFMNLYSTIMILNSINFDIISCHDIFPLLTAYVYLRIYNRNRIVKIIYDSHELEMARNTNRSRIKRVSFYCL